MPSFRSLSSVLALILLSACAHTRVGGPPAEFLLDCGAEYPVPTTNGALAKQRNQLLEDLRACNRDKAALREWAKDKEAP